MVLRRFLGCDNHRIREEVTELLAMQDGIVVGSWSEPSSLWLRKVLLLDSGSFSSSCFLRKNINLYQLYLKKRELCLFVVSSVCSSASWCMFEIIITERKQHNFRNNCNDDEGHHHHHHDHDNDEIMITTNWLRWWWRLILSSKDAGVCIVFKWNPYVALFPSNRCFSICGKSRHYPPCNGRVFILSFSIFTS